MTDAEKLADGLVAAERRNRFVSARDDMESVGHAPFVVHGTWTCQVHKSLMARTPHCADIFGMSETNLQPVSRAAIGHRLRLTREAMGLGQAEFAAKIGMTKTRYENYEAGRNLMKPEVVLALVQAFPLAKLDFNWIYRGDINGIAHELAEKIARLSEQRDVA